jgi:hypothetical protein
MLPNVDDCRSNSDLKSIGEDLRFYTKDAAVLWNWNWSQAVYKNEPHLSSPTFETR